MRRRKWQLTGGVVALLLAAAIVFACTEESTDPLPCTSAPPYAIDASFPQRDPSVPLPKRVCTPRCGDTTQWYWANGPTRATTSLPSGPCSQEGEGCAIIAVKPCCFPDGSCREPVTDAPEVRGTALEFDCRCRNGDWACTASYFGGGPCFRPGDAGAADADAADADADADAD
jgi:hypothetical protein